MTFVFNFDTILPKRRWQKNHWSFQGKEIEVTYI